jgi:S-adenosylmethionine-diacylgycerolhomoserine-N-methlytransferase
VICSYTLSMMPDWRGALDRALATLRPGGRLDVVDFWVDARWPAWLRRPLLDWLALFDVTPRPEIAEHLRAAATRSGAQLAVEPVLAGYAFRLTYWRGA